MAVLFSNGSLCARANPNPNPNPDPKQAAPSIDEAAIIHFVGREKPWMLRDTMDGKLLDPEVAIVTIAMVSIAIVSRSYRHSCGSHSHDYHSHSHRPRLAS